MYSLKGDLIELAVSGKFDVIIHGCNCFHTMGAGIAKSIKEQFPQAYAEDLKTPYGLKSKLGTISYASVVKNDSRITVVNAYTQHDWKGSGVKVDYEAVRSCMIKVKEQFSGQSIGYPMIGAGLAGGDWNTISTIINDVFASENHTLVIFDPKKQNDNSTITKTFKF